MLKTISFIRQPVLKALWSQSFPKPVCTTGFDTCPKKGPVCPTGAEKVEKSGGAGAKGMCPISGEKIEKDDGGGPKSKLVRGDPPKVRMAFLPEGWFTFMQQKTGVSGPYVLAFVFANYCLSKEIYVLEHEYYSGLSWFVIFAVVYNKFGNTIGSELDKQVDAVSNQWEASRTQEKNFYTGAVNDAKDSQWRAEGQKLLMDAKKENIIMQLEAAYRERTMLAYSTVVGRMDYHVKRYATEARIQQKWMIGWILQSVHKAITPDFQKRALGNAIAELASLASKAK